MKFLHKSGQALIFACVSLGTVVVLTAGVLGAIDDAYPILTDMPQWLYPIYGSCTLLTWSPVLLLAASVGLAITGLIKGERL